MAWVFCFLLIVLSIWSSPFTFVTYIKKNMPKEPTQLRCKTTMSILSLRNLLIVEYHHEALIANKTYNAYLSVFSKRLIWFHKQEVIATKVDLVKYTWTRISGPNTENVFVWQWISKTITPSVITIIKWSDCKKQLGAYGVLWGDVD